MLLLLKLLQKMKKSQSKKRIYVVGGIHLLPITKEMEKT